MSYTSAQNRANSKQYDGNICDAPFSGFLMLNQNHAMMTKTTRKIHQMMSSPRSTGLPLKSQLLAITVITMLPSLGMLACESRDMKRDMEEDGRKLIAA